ncbi:hypothetical protein [Sporosarcina sp. ITBMC105]
MRKTILGVKLVTSFMLTAGLLFSSIQPLAAQAASVKEEQQVEQITKYTYKVMKVLRVSLGVDKHSTVKDDEIASMNKAEVMNRYLSSQGKKMKGNEVRKAVELIFNIDLDFISKQGIGTTVSSYDAAVMEILRLDLGLERDDISRDQDIMAMKKNHVMDRYSKMFRYKLSGPEYRFLINQIYGVNLDGIANLEHAQVAIYSKGQWILKSDQDLIILRSSLDDVEVYVAPTDYYTALTGSTELPASLIAKLASMGFTYDEPTNAYYYANPTGESIPDAFKGQTLGTIVGTIANEFPKQ